MGTTPKTLEAPDDYIARVGALAAAFEAARTHENSARELDPWLVTEMHAAGLFRMLLPTWLDGAALDPLTYTSVIEEIARYDASAAWCVNQGSGCSMVVGNLDRATARQIFGKADDVLAWGPSPGAKAVIADGGYRINYSGSFASGSRHATWLGALCLVDEADGRPHLTAEGRHEMRTFIYPKAQADVRDVWHVVGLRGTGSDSFTLKDLSVRPEYSVIRDDAASRIDPSPHYRYSSTMIYSSGFAHVALGIARGFMDDFMALASHKTPREGRSSLRDSSIVQSEIAQCRAKWEAAHGYLRSRIGETWSAILRGAHPTPEQRVAIRLAATHAIHAAKDVVDVLYDAAGASAILEAGPFERRFRDIHAVTQQLQGRKSHFESVGRFMLGLPLDLRGAQI